MSVVSKKSIKILYEGKIRCSYCGVYNPKKNRYCLKCSKPLPHELKSPDE